MNRENIIKQYLPDDIMLQYDEGDEWRLERMTRGMADMVVQLIGSLGDYVDVNKSEESEYKSSELKFVRDTIIHDWASAQVALSSVAAVMRFDGEEAFERIVEYQFGPEDNELSLDGI